MIAPDNAGVDSPESAATAALADAENDSVGAGTILDVFGTMTRPRVCCRCVTVAVCPVEIAYGPLCNQCVADLRWMPRGAETHA